MPISRFSTAFKALRQLGFNQVALNGLYRLGLATGQYRRAVQPPRPMEGLLLQPLLACPARKDVLAVLGADGLQALLAEADEIVNGRFRQFGGDFVEIQLGFNQPLVHWTAYETHQSHLPLSQFPFPDIKFIWEPARFGWAFILGRAFHASGDEKYAAAFWRLFETFNAGNPPYLGPNWTSGQEVGLRLMAFVWSAQIFTPAGQSTPARLAALAASVAAHAARIPATLVYARSQNNNHLLTESAALLTAGMALPAHPQAAVWRKTGNKWLDWCFRHQIDPTGEYIQHSTNYQRLMLQTALWVHSLSGTDRLAKEKLALATHWLLALLDPQSGLVPNLGANDGALILPLSTTQFNDYRPVAQAAAQAFLGFILPGGGDEMALWFGLPAVEKPPAATPITAGRLNTSDAWGCLRAVKYHSRPSHADQLHFDLWWRGLNITQDAGTYLYNAEPPWDNRLTSTLVHNTVSVDNLEQMTRASRFLYLDWAGASQRFENDPDSLQRISAETDAYARLGIHHERVVTVSRDERWQVTDNLLNRRGQPHVLRLHWLLPDWEWKMDQAENDVELSLKSPHGWLKLVIACPRQPLERVALLRAGELLKGLGLLSPVFGWVSPTYSVKKPALSLAVEVQSAQDIQFISEFIFPVSPPAASPKS